MNPDVAVIGAGAWGTTLALVLARRGYRPRVWEYLPDYAEVMRTTRRNPKYLPGVVLPDSLRITASLAEAVEGCTTWIMATPSQRLRSVAQALARTGGKPERVISAAKGIEQGSLQRMSEVLRAEFGPRPAVAVLSGPSHAEEVSREMPCSLVAASTDAETAEAVQGLFMSDAVRVYTSDDVVGVELGGSLKNVIAIAAGIVEGLGLGDNTKAALVTRGLAEIARLGLALGGRESTFMGLSGLGDLVVTCMSVHSRNRRVGEELGRGRTLDEILHDLEMVAEGVDTTRSAMGLASARGVDMPITEQVHRILFSGVSPQEALVRLMRRTPKAEHESRRKEG